MLDQPSSIANGLKMCDSAGAYCIDITLDTSNPGAESASFSSSGSGYISTNGSVQGSEHVKLDYAVSSTNASGGATLPFEFDTLSLLGINSLTDGANAFGIRDAYTFVQGGSWTPLAGDTSTADPAVLSIDTSASDDVGIFLIPDPQGDNNLSEIGQFTVATALGATNASEVLLNMEGPLNGYNATYTFDTDTQAATLIVFNSGDGAMGWGYRPTISAVIKPPELTTVKSYGTPTFDADGKATLPVTITTTNTGVATLFDIQIADDLDDPNNFGTAFQSITAGPTFSLTQDGTSPTATLPNAATPAYNGTTNINFFDGSSGVLGADDALTIDFTVFLDPNAPGAPATLGNTAVATAVDQFATGVDDASGGGPGEGTGDPEVFDPGPLIPDLTVTKSAVMPGTIAPGQAITYTVTIQNTGSVNATNVAPTDPGPTFGGQAATNSLSSFLPAPVALATGASQAFTATYNLSQTDIDNAAAAANPAIAVANTASATGTGPHGDAANAAPGSVATGFSPASTLTVTTTPTLPGTIAAGQSITYAYTLQNTGNTTLSAVTPADPGPTFGGQTATNSLSAFSPAPVTLAPGASQSFSASYPLAQADIDNAAAAPNPAASITNTASAAATTPSGGTPTITTGTATTGISPASTITVTKSAAMPGTIAAGQAITYTVTAQNTGNTTLSAVTPADPGPTFGGQTATNALSAFSPGPVTLAPGASQAFTATYTLAQADIDNTAAAGTPATAIANTASATATAPSGGAPTVTSGSTTTGFAPTAQLTTTKSAAMPGTLAAGQTITYTVTLQNSGNTTLSAVTPTDPGPTFNNQTATNALSAFAPSPVTLAPGASQAFTATYTLAQTDIDNIAAAPSPATAVDNTASGIGTPPSGTAFSATTATVETGAAPTAGLTVTTTATLPGTFAAGQTITYTTTLQNTGNASISAATPTDPGPAFNGQAATNALSGFSPAPVTLAPGASQAFTATYTLAQADIDNTAAAPNPAAAITNTASATGNTPSGAAAPVTTGSHTTGIAPNSELTATKTAAMPGTLAAGQQITYTVTLQNTGTTTITAATPTDPGPTFGGQAATNALSGFSPGPVTLAPGASQAFTATYTLAQADIDNTAAAPNPAAAITNTATPTGTTPGGALTAITDSAATGFAATATLSASKSVTPPGSWTAGQSLAYTVTLQNTGNTTLSAVTPTDPGPTFGGQAATNALSAFSPGPVTLAPGASQAFTASYTLAQADLDNTAAAGTPATAIANTASATASAPGSLSVSVTPSSANTGFAPNRALSLTKTAAAPSPGFQIGGTIAYSYLIQNTGDVTLTGDITIADNRIDAQGGSYSCTPVASTDLAPGDTMTCTASYTITSGDLSVGSVSNNASATSGSTTSPTDSATQPTGAAPALTLSTTTAPFPASYTNTGDAITFSYTVANTGGVAITSPVTISDTRINAGTPFSCWSPGQSTNGGSTTQITPDPNFGSGSTSGGDSVTCTATYTVTQADVDAGNLANQATASSSFASAPISAPPAGLTVTATADARLSVTKTVSPAALGDASPGDVITYSYLLSNDGAATLANAVPTDSGPTFGGQAAAAALSAYTVTAGTDADNNGQADSIAPGATATVTATYTLTQTDLDNAAAAPNPAAAIANTASATATPANGTLAPVASSAATTGFSARAELLTTSSAALPGTVAAGQQITYTVTLQNTGNTTLTAATPTDPGPSFGGAAATAALSNFSPGPVSLAPGTSQTFTATYTLAQADIDNAAAAPNPATAIASTTSASATAPTGTTLTTTPASLATGFAPTNQLATSKAATMPGTIAPGQSIAYTVTLQNTGNTTLTAVSPTDPGPSFGGQPATGTLSAFSPGPVTLTPGASQAFMASYTLTQTDIDNASGASSPASAVTNTASATATAPGGAAVTMPPASVATGFAPAPALSATKSITLPTPFDAGSTVTTSVTITNSGNTTLTGVTPIDPGPTFGGFGATNSLSAFTPAPVTLAPGASQSFSATYTTDQIDIDNAARASNSAAAVANTASATGTTPSGGTISSPTTSATAAYAPVPVLTALVVADNSAVSDPPQPGDVITFTTTVTNDGDITVSNLSINASFTDGNGNVFPLTLTPAPAAPPALALPGTGPAPSAPGALQPGETATFTGSHALTQNDINSGGITATATASASTPAGGSVSDVSDDPTDTTGASDAPTAVPINRVPQMEATKIATFNDGGDGGPDPGDVIWFTYTVTNIGNVTIYDPFPVEDPTAFTGHGALPAPSYTSGGSEQDGDGQIDDLLPGETITFTAPYPLQQADISQLGVSNQVLAAGSTPAGPASDVSDDGNDVDGNATSDATVLSFTPPQLTAAKTANIAQANPGGTITFTITLSHISGGAVAGIEVVDQLPPGLAYVAGSATLNGTPTEPWVSGSELTWSGLSMTTGSTLNVTFDTLVEPGGSDSGVENTAFLRAPATGATISNIARVFVRKKPIYAFECADVIGRVFNDLNLSGAPDRGEAGIAGAHVYTVQGLRITTDAHGRYHVPCAELPATEGTNYILKLDERSLPAGWHVTTGNPRVLRLTPGKMTQFDFGAAKAKLIAIRLDARAFLPGSVSPSRALARELPLLAQNLAQNPTFLRLDYTLAADETRSLASARMREILSQIRTAMPAEAGAALRATTQILPPNAATPNAAAPKSATPRSASQ